MKISPARKAAFEILRKIESEKAFSSALLSSYEDQLSQNDRALCHEITLGVLRRQIYLDKAIEGLTKSRKIDPEVRISLRIGLYQLWFLDKIPEYSIINESVNLVQYAKKTSAKGFVNAILRRATRDRPVIAFLDEIDRISVETSHPRWLIERWAEQFGIDRAESIAEANNQVPAIAFRATARLNDGDKIEDLLKRHTEEMTGSSFIKGCFIAESFTADLRNMAENGEIYFQDEASQMVAQSIELNGGDRFLDVCAAPGSKTTLIAAKTNARSTLIAAGDLHFSRVTFLAENCRRQAVEFVSVVQYDAESPLPFADDSFDTVLVDAPCSGTGTLRHNPEIRYHLEPADLEELPLKQLRILRNASKSVKPGGTLVYSTCSLEREENEDVCSLFLESNTQFESVKPNIPERFAMEEGYARTFPDRDNMDGFFVAAFKKHHRS